MAPEQAEGRLDRIAPTTDVYALGVLHGLKAEVFADSRDHTVRLKFKERYDDQVNFGPTEGSPDPALVSDWFSITWSGWLQVPRTRRYTFVVDFDDEIKFSLDGKVLCDWTVGQSPKESAADLEAGLHALELQFRETTGTAYCKLYWIPPNSSTQEIVPKNVLFHSKPETGPSLVP